MTDTDLDRYAEPGDAFVDLAQRDHLRAILRSNMMDGDEGGTYTAACRALLTEIVELVADDWAPSLLSAAREAGREEGRRECAGELSSLVDDVLKWHGDPRASDTVLGSILGHARATAALWRE